MLDTQELEYLACSAPDGSELLLMGDGETFTLMPMDGVKVVGMIIWRAVEESPADYLGFRAALGYWEARDDIRREVTHLSDFEDAARFAAGYRD